MITEPILDPHLTFLLQLIENLGSIRGRTRLQKLVFLMQEEGQLNQRVPFFKFIPYNYGPFSRDLDLYTMIAKQLGLLEEEQYSITTPYGPATGFEFKLTENGSRIANNIEIHNRAVINNETINVARTYNRFDLKQLLEYVYSRYPNMAQAAID